jgi:hypothetical protein
MGALRLLTRRSSQHNMESLMYRMFKTLPSVATACVLAATLAACNGSPSAPSSSDAAANEGSEAGPNGETLKVQAPSLNEPANDLRLDTRKPTLVATNVAGKFVGGTYQYEFELLTDGNSRVNAATLNAGSGGTTTWVYPTDLERDTPYRWRVRARKGNLVGPWSATRRFITLLEKRTPDPAPGTRLPLPHMVHVLQQVAAENPGILSLQRSCQEEEWGGHHIRGWEFLDKVIDALRLEDTRWGYMWKRGNVGDPSLDVISYNYSAEPDEGTSRIWAVDVVGGHCGPGASITWANITGVGGSPAAWTSRGRW